MSINHTGAPVNYPVGVTVIPAGAQDPTFAVDRNGNIFGATLTATTLKGSLAAGNQVITGTLGVTGTATLANGSVDYLTVTGGATTVGVTIAAAGETDTPIIIQNAGTGTLDFKCLGNPSNGNNVFRFWINGAQRWDILGSGSLTPATDLSVALGTATTRVTSAFINTMNAGAAQLGLVSNSNTGIVISTAGAVRFATGYGSGAITSDANGNLTIVSDERQKIVEGPYSAGLDEINKINPILYKWRPESGMETEHTYAGFSAQNVDEALPEYGSGHTNTGLRTLQDRAVLAALVNAVKELGAKVFGA